MAVILSRASIRIMSRELRPDDISAALGVPPTEAFEAGSPVGGRSTRVYEQSVWILESGISPDRPLVDHLMALLAQVQDESRLAALRKVSEDIFPQIANAVDPPEIVLDLRWRFKELRQATRASGRSSCPTLSDTRNSTASAPSGPRSRSGTRMA